MRYIKIHIRNLFSYQDGLFEFPAPLDPKKNVVLIHGRNGFGKTSFINALKLFFVGTSDLEIRTMRGSRQYTQRDYILGAGAEWEGAFNRRALANKEKECSISVTWEEPLGVVSATRSWTIDGPTSVLENLHISADFPVEAGTLDDAEQRQDFIERRLPPTLVPFFIYDAEQVQRIAESNSEAVLEQIERLLDITAINTADTYVGRVLQKLRRDSNARGEQLRLEELHGHYEVARSTKGQTDAEIEMLEAQDTENKRRIAELDRKLQNSKAAVKEKNQGSIKSQLTEKKDSLEEKSAIFLENFPEIAPLISHPSLVALAIEKLKPASQGRSQLVDELRSILERLPVRLFDEPQFPKPSLTDAQQRFLKQKAELLIEAELDLASSGNDENAWSINVDRARRVEGQLAMFVATSGLRESFAFQLREITKLVRDEVILKAELEDLSSLPKADREKQEERRLERAALEESSNITREKIGMLRAQMISTSRNIEKLRGEVNFQERKVSDATRNQISVEIAEKTLAGIRLYKGALKQARQSEIQTAMNTHFKSLLDSHGLIDSIVFDEDFRMNYLDASGVRAD